jgi:hypothetical protein
MVATKTVVHVTDVMADSAYIEQTDPMALAAVALGHTRTALALPLLNEGEVIGAFVLSRQEVRPFTEKQIALITNFAAQAVIAIENARLLKELRERTSDLERSYRFVQQQASQLEAQSQELVTLNHKLEQRADQVGEIERMGRLRRFLPPQVADLIVASGTEKQLESHRREFTALFCDLGFAARFHGKLAPQPILRCLQPRRACSSGLFFALRPEMKVKTFLGTDTAEVDKLVNEWLAETNVAVRRTSAAFHRFRDRGKDCPHGTNGCPPRRRHGHFRLVRRAPRQIAN